MLEAGGRDVSADREVLLNACWNDLRYDSQCEDCRAPYLFDVCHATGEPDWYADRIRETLLEPDAGDDFAWHQLSELAARFVRMGRTDLHPAIYDRLAHILAHGGDAGATTVIRLDGAHGYRFLLQHTAHLPPSADADVEWFLDTFIDCIGETAAKQFSERLASESPTVFVPYLTRVWDERAKSPTPLESGPRRTPLDYDSLRAWVRAPNDWAATRFSSFAGKRIDEAVAKRLSADLLAETEPARQIRFLRLFGERAFPFDTAPLLPLARSDNEQLAWHALRAFRNVRNPAVRELGLELVQSFDRPHWGPMLLVHNPGEEDAGLFRDLLDRPFRDDALHRIGFDLCDYFAANPAANATDCLLRLYKRGPCSRCRGDVVAMLLSRNQLPDRLRREYRYDAHGETRQVGVEAI